MIVAIIDSCRKYYTSPKLLVTYILIVSNWFVVIHIETIVFGSSYMLLAYSFLSEILYLYYKYLYQIHFPLSTGERQSSMMLILHLYCGPFQKNNSVIMFTYAFCVILR